MPRSRDAIFIITVITLNGGTADLCLGRARGGPTTNMGSFGRAQNPIKVLANDIHR